MDPGFLGSSCCYLLYIVKKHQPICSLFGKTSADMLGDPHETLRLCSETSLGTPWDSPGILPRSPKTLPGPPRATPALTYCTVTASMGSWIPGLLASGALWSRVFSYSGFPAPTAPGNALAVHRTSVLPRSGAVLGTFCGRFSLNLAVDGPLRRKTADPHETLRLCSETGLGPPRH